MEAIDYHDHLDDRRFVQEAKREARQTSFSKNRFREKKKKAKRKTRLTTKRLEVKRTRPDQRKSDDVKQ